MRQGLPAGRSHDECFRRFNAKLGPLDWYGIDYWSETLDLDIARLKEEMAHLIQVHPDVPEFLAAARRGGKRVALVTNAHHKSLDLKMRRTGLEMHFDAIYCSHSFGVAKENPTFWAELGKVEPFRPERTLLVDDSLPVLRSGAAYGIRHLLAVRRPDTRQPPKDTAEFRAIERFGELMPI